MAVITVIDYGMGNLLSVMRAFEHCGAEVVITDSPDVVKKAERLVLPGVGAFADGMAGLRERGLIGPIREYAFSDRPFLGICLGMQMMMDVSDEFGLHEGLGLLKGRVAAIPPCGADGTLHKIPHIGWNSLVLSKGRRDWSDTIFKDISENAYVYFVHSFAVVPEDGAVRLADCIYNGLVLNAAVNSGKLYGCQFHPEKSGPVGLGIIRNFCTL